MYNNTTQKRIIVLTPVYNDYTSLEMFLPILDEQIRDVAFRVEVLIVDDGSNRSDFNPPELSHIEKINLLELRRNLGHQRAIAVGLAYIEANLDGQAVIVMDSDGEDDPKYIKALIKKCEEENYDKIVFARRIKRSEGILFRVFYSLYKLIHKILTGYTINIGNYSVIPFKLLRRLVVISEIWNHYAAGVLKAKIPCSVIPTIRSHRLSGRPKMNFISLVIHGLSSISVFGDIVGIRLLLASVFFIFIDVLVISTVFYVKLFTTLAIPGWATYTAISLSIILILIIMMSLVFIFITLSSRNYSSFIPTRDYQHFIMELREIF